MSKSLATNLVALVVILVSFFAPVYQEQFRAIGLYAFSGAITNWLAIHMLFEKVPFLHGSGVVTERFEEFKEGIRRLVMEEFFSQQNFNKFIEGSQVELDEDVIFVKFKEAIMQSPFAGMLGMFGGETALEPLRPTLMEKVREIQADLLPESRELKTQVESIVNNRLAELTPQMVKEIVQKMIKEHLGWLVVWGGVFGGCLGFLSTFI